MVTGDETSDRPVNSSVDPANRGGECENPSNWADQSPPETVIVIRSEEGDAPPSVGGEIVDTKANGKPNAAAAFNVLVVEKKIKDDEHSCVIDVESGGNGKLVENFDRETVCRICHLSSDPSTTETPPRTTTITATTPTSLIQLGCCCKDELGIVHAPCAQAWFKLKGNRRCEICGESAKNVTGVADIGFMEGWNETRPAGSVTTSSDRPRGWLRGQPFCNFLMACLVIAFVLPWFFRVNMF